MTLGSGVPWRVARTGALHGMTLAANHPPGGEEMTSTQTRLARAFWDAAARADAAWFVATGHRSADRAFFAQGALETDRLLAFCGVTVRPADTVVEIGCGVGRMTHRLAELAGQVIALDISPEMVHRAARNLVDRPTAHCVIVDGDGTLPLATGSCDVVFSYITLQHVPSVTAQLRYLREALRVLRAGGAVAIQVRAAGWDALTYAWVGHLAHRVQGRPTIDPAWRGATPDPHAIAAVSRALQIRRYDRRHAWVVGRRPEGEP